MIVEGGMGGGGAREGEGEGKKKEKKRGLKRRGDRGSLTSAAYRGAQRRRGALPGSDCLPDGARGTFPGRWPIYIGLITSNLEISPRSPNKPSPLLFQTLTPLSPPFSPCSEFPLFSQSHFLLLWLFLAHQIRDTSVISGTFEVPINNRAAWPAPEPSASSSDQRLASRRPQPWNKALYWIPKAGRAGPVLSLTAGPSSDTRPEDFHTQPIELFVLPGSTRKRKQESLNIADFLINTTFRGNQQPRPDV